MNPQLVQAISKRRVLGIECHPGGRVVEPHAYGENKDGNELLRAYQTTGASASGEHVNWKLFRIDRIRELDLTDERFPGPRPEYR
jgi:hypothetical protein